MIYYNDRSVYDCFNNPFTVDCGIPTLNLPSITIDDSPRQKKIARYTSDPLPAAIYITPGKSVSTLTNPSDLSPFIVLNY